MNKIINMLRMASAKVLIPYLETYSQLDRETVMSLVGSTKKNRLIRLIESLDEESFAQMRLDAEICQTMASPQGVVTLNSQRGEVEPPKGVVSDWDLSLWTFQNDPRAFKYAQDALQHDRYRNSRSWCKYFIVKKHRLHFTDQSLKVFCLRLKMALNHKLRIQVDHFYRKPTDGLGGDEVIFQLVVYLETPPTAQLEFDHMDNLTTKIRRSVSDISFCYSRSRNSLEIVAKNKSERLESAMIFVECFLGMKFEDCILDEDVYDLSPALTSSPLEIDKADGIEDARIVMVKIGLSSAKNAVVLESKDVAHLIRNQPHIAAFVEEVRSGEKRGKVVQIRIKVSYRGKKKISNPDQYKIKSFYFNLTAPRRSSLKERTAIERTIGEKYLIKWGFVCDSARWAQDAADQGLQNLPHAKRDQSWKNGPSLEL